MPVKQKWSTKRAGARGRREDFLDELIASRTAANPAFPRLVRAALDRRRLVQALAAERERLHISQHAIARKMRTSQPAVARLESGEVDARMSTIERYASAVGRKVRYQIVPAQAHARTSAR